MVTLLQESLNEKLKKKLGLDEKTNETDARRIAEAVSRVFPTEGWQEIEKWIKERIEKLKARIEESDIGDIKLEKTKNGKIVVNMVVVNKSSEKHQIEAYKIFLAKIENWREGAKTE